MAFRAARVLVGCAGMKIREHLLTLICLPVTVPVLGGVLLFGRMKYFIRRIRFPHPLRRLRVRCASEGFHSEDIGRYLRGVVDGYHEPTFLLTHSQMGLAYVVGHQSGSKLGRGETEFEQLPEHNKTLVSTASAS